MASTSIHSLFNPNSLHILSLTKNRTSKRSSQLFSQESITRRAKNLTITKCTNNTSSETTPQLETNNNNISSSGDEDFPDPIPYSTTLNNSNYPIDKRRRSEILRERRAKTELAKQEPPNFEIGWKRTKKINLEKPKGYAIMDFLDKLVQLMDKEFGSTELLAKVGEIVAERAREEAEVLRDEGKVEERMVTELFRVLKLMEMDLAMVKASVKQDTLSERLEQAKSRCRQAILVANAF